MHLGEYKIQCVKPGGDTLANYGGFVAAQDQIIDLLDESTPSAVRAFDYWTARTMCEDTAFELAQKIAAGSWKLVSKRLPEPIDHTEG